MCVELGLSTAVKKFEACHEIEINLTFRFVVAFSNGHIFLSPCSPKDA